MFTALFWLLALSACSPEPATAEKSPSESENGSSNEDVPRGGAEDEERTNTRDGGSAVHRDAGANGPAMRDGGKPATSDDAATIDGGSAGPVGDGSLHEDASSAAPQRELAVSADFLNKTLTVFDLSKVREGVKKADLVVATVDLGKYSPGPLSLNITPDGKTALVSISAGFLGAFIDVPPGDGTLVFVDLEKYQVTGELAVGDSPMGIVFSKDSKKAFVGLYGENYFAVVDMEKRTFQRVNTGSGYNEELSIDDTGTVGILTYGPAGNAKTFSVADPAGTLGQTTGLSGDAAGVAFFPGTKYAYLVQAPTVLTGNAGGHNVVNVEDPKRPVASDNVRMGSFPTCYPVTAIGPRKSVAYNSTADGMLSVVEMRLEGNTAKEVQRVPVTKLDGLAYGISATRDGRVLVASSGGHLIGVVDLEKKTSIIIPWEVTASGPTEVKVIP